MPAKVGRPRSPASTKVTWCRFSQDELVALRRLADKESRSLAGQIRAICRARLQWLEREGPRQ